MSKAKVYRLLRRARAPHSGKKSSLRKERSVGMWHKRSRVVARTAAATGVSVSSIHNIRKGCLSQGGEILIPLKTYVASHVHVNPDEFDREVICHVVMHFTHTK